MPLDTFACRSLDLSAATPYSLSAVAGQVGQVQVSTTVGTPGDAAHLFTPPQPATDSAAAALEALLATQPTLVVTVERRIDGSILLTRHADAVFLASITLSGEGAVPWFGTAGTLHLDVSSPTAISSLDRQRLQLVPGTVSAPSLALELTGSQGVILPTTLTAAVEVTDGNGAKFTVDVAAGSYSRAALVSQLNASIATAQAAALPGVDGPFDPFTLAIAAVTGRVTASCASGAPFRMVWAAAAAAVPNALGFTADSGLVRTLASGRDLPVDDGRSPLHWECSYDHPSSYLQASLLVNVPVSVQLGSGGAPAGLTASVQTLRGGVPYHHGYVAGDPVRVSSFVGGTRQEFSGLVATVPDGTHLTVQVASSGLGTATSADRWVLAPLAGRDRAVVHFLHGAAVRRPFGRLLHRVLGWDPHAAWERQRFSGGRFPLPAQVLPPFHLLLATSVGSTGHFVQVGHKALQVLAEVTLNGSSTLSQVRGYGQGAELRVESLSGFRVEMLHADTLELADLDNLPVSLTFSLQRR